MLDLLKKAFWVPPSDDEAVIDGKAYEIYRGYETGSRGNYGVKCREK